MSGFPTMLTISQTAERSGLAKHYIRQLCIQNKICFVRSGQKYLINFEKFADYLNAGNSTDFPPNKPQINPIRL